MSLEIRKSIDSDRSLINHIHEQAFGLENSREIITLINDLLQDKTAEPCCSLVAIQQSKIVGHILFSNVKIISDQGVISASILAPLAVIPAAQNQGIGGQLIHDGINQLKAMGVPVVFVLGYPEYYTRYGFEPAFPRGYIPPYPIVKAQSDAWMVNILDADLARKYQGKIHCADAFNHPEYWRE
ncbi:MAG: GNAT family N-acetyltransferase [Planktothrix sp.]|uniref:GNAT family N-acetyltransferase n=1 Tax=Planktothrix sp. TaxID=3088171 RepID=UPI0038D4F1CB